VLKSLTNRKFSLETERIYAGVEEPYSYSPVPVAKGALCYYQSKNGQDKWREATTFM
jgi:hypothetical protein